MQHHRKMEARCIPTQAGGAAVNANCPPSPSLPHTHRVNAALREYDPGEERSHLLRPVYSGSAAHKYEFCWCEKEAQHLKNEVGSGLVHTCTHTHGPLLLLP